MFAKWIHVLVYMCVCAEDCVCVCLCMCVCVCVCVYVRHLRKLAVYKFEIYEAHMY